jgi:hypothetical protein
MNRDDYLNFKQKEQLQKVQEKEMLLLKNLLSNEEQKKTKRLTKENRLEAI